MENINKLDPAVGEKIQDLTAYINDLMSDINTLESVMEKKMLKLTELTEQEQELKVTLKNDKERLESELDSLIKSKSEVEKSVSSLRDSIMSLEDIQKSMTIECNKLTIENTKTKKEYEQLQEEKNKTKEEFEQLKAESTKVMEENKEQLEGIQVEKKATEKILADKLSHLSALNEKIQGASVKFKRHAVLIAINLILIVITLYVLPSSELFTMKYLFVGVLVAVVILGTVTVYNVIALMGELSRLINAILENQ